MALPLPLEKRRARLFLIPIVILAIFAGFFDYPSLWNRLSRPLGLPNFPTKPYQLGLDIAGGTSLTYRADLSNVSPGNRPEAMEGLRDVVERRVNLFGVKEPRVEVAKTPEEWRLNVELAGIKDINEAIKVIGETPFLEFREELPTESGEKIIQKHLKDKVEGGIGAALCQSADLTGLIQFLKGFGEDPCFQPTALTGKYLSRADIDFEPTTGKPVVGLQFNDEGAKIFADITSRNVGKRIAIYLDGAPISAPVVRETIPSGRAQISGTFTVDDAKQLARRLNEGALPVPITPVSQRSVGSILGEEALAKSIKAGIIGFLLVSLFMLLFYRLSGIVAVGALLLYTGMVLLIFKIIPVTLTLAGIAGFVLSVGMAVDANILIFERTKEELRKGTQVLPSLREGFSRAWPSIRDSNISTIITAIVLYTFATSIVKGFALTLLIGVLVSMFSAISVSRTLLLAFLPERAGASRWWFAIKKST